MSKNDLKIKAFIPSCGFNYFISLSDGTKRELNCEHLIELRPEFKKIRKPEIFFYSFEIDRYAKSISFTDKLSLSIDELIKYSRLYDVKKENEETIKRIYSYCKEIRKKEKITQKQMSEIIDMPQSAIARIESGKKDIQLSTLINYLKPLGLALTIAPRYVPNKTTQSAIEEADDIVSGKKKTKTYKNLNDLWADLGV